MQRLANHPAFLRAEVVLLYHALPDEPDTDPILADWATRKTLLLPVVKGDKLVVRQYSDAASLCCGAFGIAEPTGEAWTRYDAIDLIIVPGVAFDAHGHRLGRGRGYYDKLLALPQLHQAYKLGLCFDFQKVDDVPSEVHDILMDEVL